MALHQRLVHQSTKNKNKKRITHRVSFDSLLEAATWGGDLSQPRWKRSQSMSESSERTEFAGTASYNEALQLVKHGWKEGRTKLVQNVDALALKKDVVSLPSFVYDVAGARPEVSLAVAGDPCCMWDANPLQDSKVNVLRFVVEVVGNCAWTQDAFINYGSAILSVIDSLEANNNCSVELVAAIPIVSYEEERRQEFLIKIKEAGQHVDFDVMAFALAHPSMLRRIGFACMERIVEDNMEDIMTEGYGRPATLDETALDGAYHIPGLNYCGIPRAIIQNNSHSKELFDAVMAGFNNLVNGKPFAPTEKV